MRSKLKIGDNDLDKDYTKIVVFCRIIFSYIIQLAIDKGILLTLNTI